MRKLDGLYAGHWKAKRGLELLRENVSRIQKKGIIMYLTTFTGKKLYPENPDPEQIEAKDIAHALSMICRFGGHSGNHYSVAQHSLHVSQVVRGVDESYYLEGLLHDAAEAYVGDLPTPLKVLCPDFKRLEKRFESAVRKRFGLPEIMPPACAEVVKFADQIVLAAEVRDLNIADPAEWNLPEPSLNMKIHAWDRFLAEKRFLEALEIHAPRYFKTALQTSVF